MVSKREIEWLALHGTQERNGFFVQELAKTAQQLYKWLIHCDDYYKLSPDECDICQDIINWLEDK